MTKKKTNIEQHKDADLDLGRDELLKIINADAENASAVKNKIEAIKLLSRMHKALAPDKTIIKAEASAGAFNKTELTMPELKPELKERLHSLLNVKPS